jgi:vancomycin aglycone glucosyltransferase
VRVLLSTIGSRGDVQLVLALALKLTELGQEVRLCAPPDFRELVETLGIPFVQVGPEVRQTASAQAPPSPEQMRQVMEDTVAGQFEAITAAARGCDVLLAGMSLQFALHSVAELMGIPYVYAAWCPITLPSPHHAPPPLSRAPTPAEGTADNRTLWAEQAKRWNDMFGPAINTNRASAGLAPITDVRSHSETSLRALNLIGPGMV